MIRAYAVLAATATLTTLSAVACGPSGARPPSTTAAEPPASVAPAPPPPEPAAAPAPAPEPAATTPAPPPTPPPASPPQAEVTTSVVTGVNNEITTPAVVTPDRVIAGLRPKFNACFAEGLKKDPKTSGSVTLSAKIEKDGKVSAVTPKMLTGFSPAVVKCLSDHLKAASFAAAGGMNYTTSLDIPLSFTSNQ